MRTNLNADVGEGFDDAPLLAVVGSANVACGFHAGDPRLMHRTVEAAMAAGVSVGAHVGFRDPEGFGRRPVELSTEELEHLVVYQLGALQAIARRLGAAVTHVKPHGALYNMAAQRPDYALAIGRAILGVDPSIIYVGLAGSAMVEAARSLGVPAAAEAFADRAYEDDGSLSPRSAPGAVVTDPDLAAERAVAMVHDGAVKTRAGRRLALSFDTLCVHGDEPGAAAVGAAVRRALEASGVELVTLPELRLTSHRPRRRASP